MPILIDGNNLLHSLPQRSRSREDVRRLVLDQTRDERVSVTIVFDGAAEPGAPPREYLGQVSLEYSGAITADDAIIARIPRDASARSWVVVTNDRGLARRARARGAGVRTVAEWTGRRGARRIGTGQHEVNQLGPDEISEWERFFAAGRSKNPEDSRER